MILSGRQIQEQIREGGIKIDPFSPNMVGPNSYNLSLHESLQRYTTPVLDMALRNPVEDLVIPKEGLLLEPGELYLGRTVEHTETNEFVPMLEGRSSVGRLGIFVHVTAGFGDIGFSGTWTLEIMVVKPTRIYPNVPICQIYFHTIEGECDLYKSQKYQGQRKIVASKLWKDITVVPPSCFFSDLEAKHREVFEDIIGKGVPGPFSLVVELNDQRSSIVPEDKSLPEYKYHHPEGLFDLEEIQRFFAEIPSCLGYAAVTMRCTTTGVTVATCLEIG